MADDLAVFFNPDEFGERLTFTPKDGNSRTVLAEVTRSQQLTTGDPEIDQAERLVVRVGKDPASDVGGIDSPRIGDAIDFDGKRYAWSGAVLGEDPVSWRLEFARRRSYQAGTTNTQL